MDIIWGKIKSFFYRPMSKQVRPSPRMADVAMEVLQNLGEEAKDVVYHEALNRVHGESDKPQSDISKEPKNWSTLRRRVSTIRRNSLLNQGAHVQQEQETHFPSPLFTGESFIGRLLRKPKEVYSRLRNIVFDPESDFYYFWTGTVALAILYNFWVIILRVTFSEMRGQDVFIAWVFACFDLLADIVYILDVGVQSQTAYLENGILVRDLVKLRNNYKNKAYSTWDIISMSPLSFIVNFLLGAVFESLRDPLLFQLFRIHRLFKWHTITDFFEMSDSRTNKPYAVRAIRLTIYLSIIIHWFACFYFMLCEYEGFGTTAWTYPELRGNDDVFTRKYIKSLFWSALTLTTIGENESPETTLEYVFTGCTFIIGVLLFATIVGNMGDVISSINAARVEFQQRMDGIKRYMEHHEIPGQLQDRVKRWLQYSWLRTKALEEESTLGLLPHRLRTEIAIHVHLETLKKVKIFKDCEQGFLCELVLKLRYQIFSPEDYICRIGEIGRDMYIINHGKVEIVVRDSVSGAPVVVASLSEGNYFGEISLLRLDGGTNRRSADVRSVGYSELLCLSKSDLMEALEEYPDAKQTLEAQGRDRLQRTKKEKSDASKLSVKKTESAKNENEESNLDNGMKELRSLVQQLKCFDRLEEKLEATQLQNKCETLSLQVQELETELKKTRKKAYIMERLLLQRTNGWCCFNNVSENQETQRKEDTGKNEHELEEFLRNYDKLIPKKTANIAFQESLDCTSLKSEDARMEDFREQSRSKSPLSVLIRPKSQTRYISVCKTNFPENSQRKFSL